MSAITSTWAQLQKILQENRILCGAPERTVRYLVMVLFVRAKSVSPYRIQKYCFQICMADRMGELFLPAALEKINLGVVHRGPDGQFPIEI